MKILIATPSYGGTVITEYMTSVLNLFIRLASHKIESQIMFKNFAEITKVRNYFASYMLENEDFTHLLFIDSDMYFAPEVVMQMIEFNQPLTGVVYPKRALNPERLYQNAKIYDDFSKAYARSLDWVMDSGLLGEGVTATKEGTVGVNIDIKHGCFAKSTALGTGLMLVKREVFKKLKDIYPDLYLSPPVGIYKQWGLEQGVLQCFEGLKKDGVHLSEDISFCRRWIEGCGGEVWANIKEPIGHLGTIGVQGAWLHAQ